MSTSTGKLTMPLRFETRLRERRRKPIPPLRICLPSRYRYPDGSPVPDLARAVGLGRGDLVPGLRHTVPARRTFRHPRRARRTW